MPTQLSILVYKGIPVDFPKYRHTALHALYNKDTGDNEWLHVVGAHPFFKFQKDPQNPISEEPIVWIPVCTVPESVTRAMIHAACSRTAVRNEPSNWDWNCQNWVGEALAGLVDVEAVSEEQRGLAIGVMADVILEAEDEEFDNGMY
ncbi:hypothetical protein PENANT_c002G09753 [Penicillium antarcticum]|uniref:Uncharacterized protein n=1 Tax=Penicillium antarcticum TaxID=416450 RepID=A0A1V6QJS0_9EURO|nr:uncharacterized protein N7508_008575 [Penicillium antarcticum]KAJ5293754.1 hypothetical protein N7508_008575 [Penicillium antarcticum]OQD89451.1 hypothetical protein PENANT_c002G09753 [Penicillium antarcticum]